MKLANEDVSMLAFTTEQITAPFLLPEMVLSHCCAQRLLFSIFFPNETRNLLFSSQCILSIRSCYIFRLILSHLVTFHSNFYLQVERVASMLNYFLLQLVGPQRRSLSLKDPEKYEFRPKELLKQVCTS